MVLVSLILWFPHSWDHLYSHLAPTCLIVLFTSWPTINQGRTCVRSLLQMTLVDETKGHSQSWNWMISIWIPSSLPFISNHPNDFDKPSLWFNMDVTQKNYQDKWLSASCSPLGNCSSVGWNQAGFSVVTVVTVVHSLSCVQLFATSWTAACQALLSPTISQRLLRFTSIFLCDIHVESKDGLSKSFEWLEMKGRDEGVKMEVIQFQFWEWHLISSTNVVCRRLLTLVLPWCYLIISSSAVPFSFCLQSFPASGSFPMS